MREKKKWKVQKKKNVVEMNDIHSMKPDWKRYSIKYN